MSQQRYPQPPSHRTFNFGPITFDSNFDSGNCCQVEKISYSSYELWISTDNPKNNYRTWFYFSVCGFNQGSCVSFKIKNMQNQSKLLSEGLVPVYREQSSSEWRRIKQRINLSSIEYNEGWIQWTFKHTFTSSQKVFFAFFYPWSNEDNNIFLNQIQQQVKSIANIYFYRQSIVKTLQGRNLDVIVISSNTNKRNRQQKIDDKALFQNKKKPISFNQCKKGIVLSARVHPGEVPGSHVLNGIIKQITSDTELGGILRDNFVFYLFPILNPDGVARGHYRVDTNGVNLNRCYLNPTLKSQPTIYAIRSLIMHLHNNNRFFAFLDLHAHASRKGTFIYGNSLNQLQKQVDTCIFPKILSLNSADFEYEGSNFTQQNMYCKDRGDHMSKQGSGRVAMYKATKNAYCWTLECNYNMSKVNNLLQSRRTQDSFVQRPNQNTLDSKIIVNYKPPAQKQATQFFTLEIFHKLGKQICESFLDLVQKNPVSRIDNPKNYFKSLQNLKMNLAVALLRMAPNRFESNFRKIYTCINSQTPEYVTRALQALYLIIIKNAKITNINTYIKEGDSSVVIIQSPKKAKSASIPKPKFVSSLLEKPIIKKGTTQEYADWKSQKNIEKESVDISEFRSSKRQLLSNQFEIPFNIKFEEESPEDRIENIICEKLRQYEKQMKSHRITSFKLQTPKIFGIGTLREQFSYKQRALSPVKKYIQNNKSNKIRFQDNELPILKKKTSLGSQEQKKNIFKVEYARDPLLFVEAD